MSIVTGTGDDGRSALFGGGKRVTKHHPRLEAYGSIDEAQSAVGMVRSGAEIPVELDDLLAKIQKDLFTAGSDLATPDPEISVPRITSQMIIRLESECEQLEKDLPELKSFIIPTGTNSAATCFWARSVVRRAERNVSGLLAEKQDVGAVLVYLNRLSDLLFLVARALNIRAGVSEEEWSGKD